MTYGISSAIKYYFAYDVNCEKKKKNVQNKTKWGEKRPRNIVLVPRDVSRQRAIHDRFDLPISEQSNRDKMGRKGRGKSGNGNRGKIKQRPNEEMISSSSHSRDVEDDSNQETSSTNDHQSLYSAKVVQCTACLKPKEERPYSNKPTVKEIMNILRESKPSIENVRRSFQLLNELLDNYEPPVAEIHRQGLDIVLVQGIQFENSFVQYYAIHALSVIAKHMNAVQLKSLVPRGLLTGLMTVLQRDVLFIVQEGIEACANIAVKSVALRDVIAACGSLHVSELLCRYYQTISAEFSRVVAFFLRDLCKPKPIPEFIQKRVANGSRFLLRHQNSEVRLAALSAILEVASSENFTVIFDDTYVELILAFLDSPYSDEVKAAFDIAAQLLVQLNCNTDTIIKLGFIMKILPILARYSAPDFGFQTCSFLTILLSKRKKAAYKALLSMYKNFDFINAIKLAAETYLNRMCNILASDNNDYVLYVLSLISYMLEACSEQKAEVQLELITDYIKETEAYGHIIEYIDSKHSEIQRLAREIYSVYLINADFSDISQDNLEVSELVDPQN
uniref:Uncharacterized protein n=1 Tax=Setaria digitata TaxID=48799 RepID=A0A915PTY7_9BILA